MISKDDILKALSRVKDPKLGKDLVKLDAVTHIDIKDKTVALRLSLNAPSVQSKMQVRKACTDAIRTSLGEDVVVKISITNIVTNHRKQSGNHLSGVKNIIAVASGKGGVGKSTVAANLALSLARDETKKVGLMDADIYGPSAPTMFGIRGERPKMAKVNGKGMIVPLERYGIKIISMGLLVDEKQATVWRGPMVSSAIKQFVSDVYWGELDYLIIDLPPGTGDIHLTMVQTIPVTGVVIVTTPQQVALADARKGVSMFSTGNIKVPVLGIIENMSYFTPPELPDNKYYIFGKEGGKRLCRDYNIPLLGQIPIVESICEGGDVGVPAMMGDDEITKAAFADFAKETERQVVKRKANLDPTEVVKITEYRQH